MNKKEFNNIFKELRIERNISQDKIAKDLNVSQSLINNWEANKSTPAPDMLINIANYFDVSIDFLVGRTTDTRWYDSNHNNTFRNQVYEKLGLIPLNWQSFITSIIADIIDDAIKVNEKNFN